MLSLAAGIILVLLFVFPPASTSWYPQCPLHLLTGLDCPGCGSQRAVHAMLHGRFPEAFRHNPLLLISLPLLAIIFTLRLRRAPCHASRAEIPAALSRALASLIIIYFIVRNLPGYPFGLWSP